MLSLRRNYLVLLMVVAAGLLLTASRSAASTGPVPPAPTVDRDAPVARIGPEELQRLLDERDVVLIDVRSHEAYAHAHLPEAVSIPLDELEAALERLRTADVRIVLYCNGEAGLKSGRAAALLARHGFQRVYCLDGGLQRWVASGRVVFVQPTDS